VKLRFSTAKIERLAREYESNLGKRDRRLTHAITRSVFPSYEANGSLTKEEFLTVCSWKTPRTKSRCESNDEQLINEVSKVARTTDSERLRIQIWTLLFGVGWPTASVFLHFAFPNQYPILDIRALWSLREEVPSQYDFAFWWDYTTFCRSLAEDAGVSMRVLDQALWQYSKMHESV